MWLTLCRFEIHLYLLCSFHLKLRKTDLMLVVIIIIFGLQIRHACQSVNRGNLVHHSRRPPALVNPFILISISSICRWRSSHHRSPIPSRLDPELFKILKFPDLSLMILQGTVSGVGCRIRQHLTS